MKSKNNKKGMMQRMLVLLICVLFLFGLDGFRILYLQLAKGDELSAKAESQQLSDTEVSAMRGNIYDEEGNILAQSATVWNVFIDPGNITDEKKRTLVVDFLSSLLKLDEKGKQELLEKSKQKNHYAIVAEKVENGTKEKIAAFSKEHKLGNIIGMEQTTRRYYPYGTFASSVLGFVGNDNQGLSGLEAYYDEELRGKNGRIITVKDSMGNKLPTDYETQEDAVDGYSLVLTLNQTIQYYLEKGLRQTLEEYKCKGAYGVVMDCNTGAVLAMSSLPDYDCNEPYKITYAKSVGDFEKKLRAIERKAKEMGYERNVMASNLRKGVAKTVGIIVPRINRQFFSNVISSAESILEEAGYTVIICQSHETLEDEIKALKTMRANQVAGVLISHSIQSVNGDLN